MSAVSGADRCGWPQAILFDLDGTLIDSAPDIAAAVNVLLSDAGKEPLSLDEVRSMIGNGVKKLVERAFAARGEVLEGMPLDTITDMMMAIYADHLTVLTAFMPGAEDIVQAYARAGVKIGVVTNKPESFTHTILAHFGLAVDVAVVVGGDTGPERKPAPDMLLHACEVIGLHPQRCLMVGDSPADIGAAKAARMASIAVRGGYTNVAVEELGADMLIDNLSELPRAIEALKEPV